MAGMGAFVTTKIMYCIGMLALGASIIGVLYSVPYILQNIQTLFFNFSEIDLDKVVVTLGPASCATLVIPFLVPVLAFRRQLEKDKMIGKDLCFATIAIGLTPAFSYIVSDEKLANQQYSNLIAAIVFVLSCGVLGLFFCASNRKGCW